MGCFDSVGSEAGDAYAADVRAAFAPTVDYSTDTCNLCFPQSNRDIMRYQGRVQRLLQEERLGDAQNAETVIPPGHKSSHTSSMVIMYTTLRTRAPEIIIGLEMCTPTIPEQHPTACTWFEIRRHGASCHRRGCGHLPLPAVNDRDVHGSLYDGTTSYEISRQDLRWKIEAVSCGGEAL